MLPVVRAWTSLMVVAFACAACGGRGASTLGRDGPPAAATVEVLNRATLDMVVYVVPDGGVRERLGLAIALGTTHFTVPQRMLVAGTLRFQADPIGSTRVHTSQQILVSPGDTVVVQIPPI